MTSPSAREDDRTPVQREIDASLTPERLAVHEENRRSHATPLPVTADWLYNAASGVLYGPDPDHPGLRYPVATDVQPPFGYLIAGTMNRAADANQRVVDAWTRCGEAVGDLAAQRVALMLRDHALEQMRDEFFARATALASPAPALQPEEQPTTNEEEADDGDPQIDPREPRGMYL